MIDEVGALCFGAVAGYITYRTLVRSNSGGVSDLAAVLAAIGGGTVTTVFDPQAGGHLFAWYSIGLFSGFIGYGILYFLVNGSALFGKVMGDRNRRPDSHR